MLRNSCGCNQFSIETLRKVDCQNPERTIFWYFYVHCEDPDIQSGHSGQQDVNVSVLDIPQGGLGMDIGSMVELGGYQAGSHTGNIAIPGAGSPEHAYVHKYGSRPPFDTG